MFDPSLNIFGRVAFMGFTFVGDTQVLGIFTSRGGEVTTVADSTGDYASFGRPSLNDLGKVVFAADLDELPNGLPIQSVFTCSEALNNLGQIVMPVQSENPETFEVRTFIVKATPRALHK